MENYPDILTRFEDLVRRKDKDRTMVVLIIDSPWLPGYAGVNTLDFFFDPKTWFEVYQRARQDLPGVAFVPGTWVEYGMALEPSGFGAPIQWSRKSPPSVRPYPGGLTGLLDAAQPDPETDGLMPVALRQYERMKPKLSAEGMAPRMAAARGPLAVASHLLGVTEFLMATQLDSERSLLLLEKTTALCIEWLDAQLKRMEDPVGVLVLDDIVGMLGPEDAARFAFPFFQKIFEHFPKLIHLFHNDTPNEKVFPGLSKVGMDVFNFSHEIEVEKARDLLGPDIVLMGNLPPLDLLVRGTPEQVQGGTRALLQKAERFGPLLISPGGGVSPETPIDNLKAMLDAARSGF
jgi:uroporphyrinogen decarboxylase